MSNLLFSFGVVSDVQYAQQSSPDQPQRFPTLSLEKLHSALEEFNKQDLAFIIHLGDLIDRGESNFADAFATFAQARAPVKYVLGNHDFCFDDYSYGNKAGALRAYGITENEMYYSFVEHNWRFIVLDSNEVGVIEEGEESGQGQRALEIMEQLQKIGKPNGNRWNGGLSEKQIEWLLAELDAAEASDQKCILFAHHGIFPEHRENLLNDESILNLLTPRKEVKAYINGHNHDGDYGEKDGLHCWTVEGILDFADKTAYATVDVFSDKLIVNGHGRIENRVLHLR